MDLKQIFLALIKIKIIQCTVYYSNNDVRTYRESVSFCQSIGGRLLRYGELFNQVIRTCGRNTSIIQTWTGTPWYRFEYCFDNKGTVTTPLSSRQEDKDVGVCADFCANENYTHFAVQTAECTCYDSKTNVTKVDCSEKTNCPGNTFDKCGKGTFVYLVYKKTYNSTNSCVGRTFQNARSNGQEFVLSSPDSDLCSDSAYKLNYLCQVGQDDSIVCNLEQSSFPITDKVMTTTTSSIESLPDHDKSLGFSIGLAVSGCLLLLMIISIVVCWRIRIRSADSKHKVQENIERSRRTDIHRYDSVSSKNMKGDRNDKNVVKSNDIYDSVILNPVVSNNSDNNYRNMKSDGVYDSANQSCELTLTSENKKPDDNLNVNYDYSMASEDVYNLTSQNQKSNEIASQRTYDSNYGCTVKPDGVYDHAVHTTRHPEKDVDNIYDHQLNDIDYFDKDIPRSETLKTY